MKRFYFWTPRVLAVMFIVFISVFSLDVFSEPSWPLALLMHLIPTYILIALTWIAWRKEWYGGIGFILFGIYVAVVSHTPLLYAPSMIIGALFILLKNTTPRGKRHGRT